MLAKPGEAAQPGGSLDAKQGSPLVTGSVCDERKCSVFEVSQLQKLASLLAFNYEALLEGRAGHFARDSSPVIRFAVPSVKASSSDEAATSAAEQWFLSLASWPRNNWEPDFCMQCTCDSWLLVSRDITGHAGSEYGCCPAA